MTNEANYIDIPTWDNGIWVRTVFKTKEEFRDFIKPLFKEPGKYEFDETSFIFNAEARRYNTSGTGGTGGTGGVYCTSPFNSKDYRHYWDTEKDKCRNGVIYKHGPHTWYLCREYYMWLNFLPIFDKEEKKYGFAKVRDAQYHMALYELLAELHNEHAAILKKRQIASSYFHIAKIINLIWFEEGISTKMGASLKDYINEKGSWKFLAEYKNFLDEHTAWYRPMNPQKVLMWQQQIEVTKGNRKTFQGNKGTIQGISFEKDAVKGVGGPCKFFFYEEAGIAPTMDTTVEYLLPALQSGLLTTGLFVAAGSVGDLDQCEPLKSMILTPEANNIYAVETNLIDEDGTTAPAGLFIPEQWSMPPYIDQFGNSLVEEALTAILAKRVIDKAKLSAEKYQLRISQGPINIQEAFAYRKLSIFSAVQIHNQQKRIDEKQYAYEFLEFYRDETDKVCVKESNKLPIKDFPLSNKLEDKEGIPVIYERPVKDPEFGLYYASIDPVGEGKTTTSESLCSIYIYKNAVEVTREKMIDGELRTETFIEGDKIVAAWCGRYDDITKTHERLEMMIEWYNAWTIVENNISLFIQHMIFRKKQKYLVPKDQVIFLKDLGANQNVYQDYGWKNTGVLFKTHLLSYAIEFVTEVIDTETKSDGTIVKKTFGVERIPDPMLLKEMMAYQPGLNVDRLVAFAALIAFVKVQQSSKGLKKRVEQTKENLDKSKNMYKLNKSPFTHMGTSNSGRSGMRPSRNPFKNLR